MNPWSEAVWGWLADYYALATVVLLATVAALGLLRQPGRRLSVARSAVGGLAALAVLAALPGWPRVSWPSLRPAATGPIDHRRGRGAGPSDRDSPCSRGSVWTSRGGARSVKPGRPGSSPRRSSPTRARRGGRPLVPWLATRRSIRCARGRARRPGVPGGRGPDAGLARDRLLADGRRPPPVAAGAAIVEGCLVAGRRRRPCPAGLTTLRAAEPARGDRPAAPDDHPPRSIHRGRAGASAGGRAGARVGRTSGTGTSGGSPSRDS